MGDIKLFRIGNGAKELQGSSAAIEKSLQTLIETNMEVFFGISFLASEYSTGKNHGGRIDSLGLDENHCPVILEYKRSVDENVISQGLFYLDWLMDHKAEFKFLVMDKLGKQAADKIDWSGPRLVCIAGDFTKYDEHAVKQINRNIELIRYRKYGDELILFELMNAVVASETPTSGRADGAKRYKDKTVMEALQQADVGIQNIYSDLRDFILDLGDDVQEKVLKLYVAFKRSGISRALKYGTKLSFCTLILIPIEWSWKKAFLGMFETSVTGAQATWKCGLAAWKTLKKPSTSLSKVTS